MYFQYYSPVPALENVVHRYAYYHSESDEVGGEIRFLPTGCSFILLNRGDPFAVHNGLYPQGIPQAGNILVGQQQRYYTVVPGRHYAQFTILLKPAGLHRLFGIPLDGLLNNAMPLEVCLPSFQGTTFCRLGREEGLEATRLVEAAETFLGARLKGTSTEPTCFEKAIESVIATRGMVAVSSLAEQAGVSIRHFRRAFTRRIGINPKGFIKIVRLQSVLRDLKEKRAVVDDWCRIALDYGYYDQTHFIKNFKAFCGESPSAYMSRISERKHEFERFFLAALV